MSRVAHLHRGWRRCRCVAGPQQYCPGHLSHSGGGVCQWHVRHRCGDDPRVPLTPDADGRRSRRHRGLDPARDRDDVGQRRSRLGGTDSLFRGWYRVGRRVGHLHLYRPAGRGRDDHGHAQSERNADRLRYRTGGPPGWSERQFRQCGDAHPRRIFRQRRSDSDLDQPSPSWRRTARPRRYLETFLPTASAAMSPTLAGPADAHDRSACRRHGNLGVRGVYELSVADIGAGAGDRCTVARWTWRSDPRAVPT